MKKTCNSFIVPIVLALILCVPAYAQTNAINDPVKTIRVGYILSVGYQEGGENEYKTGFGYEFYQKISYYTNWEYEYVYGGFSELVDKLKSGEIDIIGNLSYTEERAKSIDFSSFTQGYETYYLLTASDNIEIDEDHLSALNGKKVGISKGSIQYTMFLDWCKENNIQCNVIEYAKKAEREGDLNSGAIDATVTTRLVSGDPNYYKWRAAARIGDSPYYFGVSKKSDPTIIRQLNDALYMIYDANSNYFDDVHAKYFYGRLLTSDFWTSEEKKWLNAHDDSITVGYLDNYMPFCDINENGDIDGAISELSGMVKNSVDITLKYVAFSQYEDMKAALLNDQIDVIFPVYGDYWAAEQQGLFLTNTIMSMNSMLLYNGEYSHQSTQRIAVSNASPFQQYIAMINFPDAELVQCGSIRDSIRAVITGEADSTVALNRFMLINNSISIDRLSELTLVQPTSIAFAVNRGNSTLLSICDKWLQVIGADRIRDVILNYSNIDKKYSLTDIIADNPIASLAIALTIILLISFGFIMYIISSKRYSAKLQLALTTAENAKKDLENSNIRNMISQMKPHFLYNALSAIQTIISVNPDYASDLIYDFTTYLRSSIKALSSDAPIPFSKELENINAYLNIEKMRFGDKLKVVYQTDYTAFSVPPLSIQPLAENAARHGLYPKAEEGGTIWIRSYKTDHYYIVEVEDDGEGFDVQKVLNHSEGSVGLKNLIYRFKSFLNAYVDITSEIGKGTIAKVRIPIIQKKENNEDNYRR